jgi:hypothetical protein
MWQKGAGCSMDISNGAAWLKGMAAGEAHRATAATIEGAERDLARRASAGCATAVGEVLGVVTRLRVAEEARSELALRIAAGKPVLAGYSGTGSLKAFLRQCATNEARDQARMHLRRERLLQEASLDPTFMRSVAAGCPAVDEAGREVRERLLEPCIELHFARGAVGRPRKLLTAAEGGLFRTLAGLCQTHEALLAGSSPRRLTAPHKAFEPLLELYADASCPRSLAEVGATSLLNTIDQVAVAMKSSSQRDQCKLRELFRPLGGYRDRLAASLRAA